MSTTRDVKRRPLLVTLIVLFTCAPAALAQLPPVPAPPQNPITEAKRVLGKMLFWEAQLSSDNSVACGTCHVPVSGGADPRLGAHPGPDGVMGTPDDKTGSPGVIRADANDTFILDQLFGTSVQSTARSANTPIMAAYAPDLFWDGRATSQFVDPETGIVAIPVGGALESQAVGPPTSDVEMAHEQRDWTQIADKLATVRPLALTTEIPPDVMGVLAPSQDYPSLFASAFGDPEINAQRIAFAIATYERTLIPDQTPFDMGTMTPQQQQGFNTFLSPQTRCNLCHTVPLFTDNTFRNIGVRPIVEDNGRQGVTGNPADAGRFKVPTLRNAGLKQTFMHNGEITAIEEVIDFYAGPVLFPQNVDPLMQNLTVPPFLRANLADFLRNALTDPRVVNEQFPFDRPTLHTELPANPLPISFGSPGTGGTTPSIIAVSPPNLGNASFKIGVADALPGATAHLALSRTPPAPGGTLTPYELVGPFVLDQDGIGTWSWPIPDDPALLGDRLFAQWLIDDPSGIDGEARTRVVEMTFYRRDPTQCDGCPGDTDCNSVVGFTDLLNVIATWGPCDLCAADVNDDGAIDFADILDLIGGWGPCP